MSHRYCRDLRQNGCVRRHSPEHTKHSRNSSGQSRKLLLRVTRLAISDLKLNPNNPRVHSECQLRKLAKSIQTFGFVQPVLIDDKRRVITGHGRIAAAKLLGLRDVPTICIRHLSEPQLRALLLADNRLAQEASWNDRLLGEQLKFLSEVDLSFDLEVTGFDVQEINLLIGELSSPAEGVQRSVNECLKSERAVPVSKPGDVWLAGKHRVHCGNAQDEASFSYLMGGHRAAAVFFDPPCQMQNCNPAVDLGRFRNDLANSSSGNPDSESVEFLTRVCTLLAINSEKGSVHYVCTDWRCIEALLAASKNVYSELLDVCVWNKGKSQKGKSQTRGFYLSQHQLTFVLRNGDASPGSDFRSPPIRRGRTNLWDYPGLAKPVALVADAICDYTTKGEIVLDPFLGSGTSLIAAEQTGRICYGMEGRPPNVDAAVRRWQKFTGHEVIHASSARKFSELEKDSGYVN